MYFEVKDISKRFKGFEMNSLSFGLEKGEILALVGESGSGKSTALRTIAGLEHLDSGNVTLKGLDITNVSVHERDMGFVFQDYALFPHLNVRENICLNLEDASDLDFWLMKMDLEGQDLKRIDQLSGGQQQRVALIRSLIRKPTLLLLDEPLSNLDVILKAKARTLLSNILAEREQTTIIVTHDYKDAEVLADKVAIMRAGDLLQFGTLAEVKASPVNEYVSALLGL